MDEPEKPQRVPVGRVARVAPLVGLAGRTAGEAVAATVRARRQDGSDLTEFHTRQAERYAELLGRSRGVLMKAGQMLSFVTLDPAVEAPYREIYQAAFARLQDDAPPMPPQLAADTITAELGRPPRELFAHFEARPLAAASIGQVHAATLPDGRRVAVKVQYPGVEEAIRADLRNTELVATFLRLLLTVVPGAARLDVRAVAQEVSDRIGEEIDYRVEAANQMEFAEAYRGHPFIAVPQVLPELSTRRVLTMELVDGLRYAKALAAEQSMRNQWGEAIFRFHWANLHQRGLFNADPHPGNYLFHPDGGVTFLDFGCVKRFTPGELRHFGDTVQAVIDGDADRLMRATIAADFVDLNDLPDRAALLAVQSEAVRPFTASQPFTYTPTLGAQMLHNTASPRGPHFATVRKLTGKGGRYTFIPRVVTGMTAVLGDLGATGPWRAIHDEYCSGGAPATRFGELEAEYLAGRR